MNNSPNNISNFIFTGYGNFLLQNSPNRFIITYEGNVCKTDSSPQFQSHNQSKKQPLTLIGDGCFFNVRIRPIAIFQFVPMLEFCPQPQKTGTDCPQAAWALASGTLL